MENLENEMVSISESDLLILLKSSLMLKNHMENLTIDDCYNLFIDDGSLSDTYSKTGEYSDEDYEEMEDRVESYLTLLDNVTKSIVDFLPDIVDFLPDYLINSLNEDERRSYRDYFNN